MKKLLVLTAGLVAAGACLAQEQGRVISTTPLIQQVAVPRQVCSNEQVAVQTPKTGAGAAMGALAGGALGNAAGGGQGKAALTVLGIIGGAVLGDRVEGGGGTQVQTVQNCNTQTFFENRTTAYRVVYEFNGKQYTVQLPNDPGPFVQLQVTPVNAQPVTSVPLSQATVVPTTQVVYSTPSVVYASPGVYQPYYYPSVALGVGLGLGVGYYGWRGGYGTHGGHAGHQGGHGGHWR